MALVENILGESTDFSKMKSFENVSVVPILLKEIVKHKSLTRSLEEKNVQILESDSVNVLKIKVKKNERPILIPFLQIVGGGKQDRMLTRPIIIPVQSRETIITIPVNCVERGRWSYNRSSGKASSIDFYSHKTVRMSPSLGSVNYLSGQGKTWNSINYYKDKMNMHDLQFASSSYLEMGEELVKDMNSNKQERTNLKKERIEFLKNSSKIVKNQCGLALFIDNMLIGLEIYGSPELWEDQAEGVINSFLTELTIRDSTNEQTDLERLKESFKKFLKSIKLRENKDLVIGSGKLHQTDTDENYSALLLEDDEKPVEFYYAKKNEGVERGNPLEHHNIDERRQRQREIRTDGSRTRWTIRSNDAIILENQKVNYDEMLKNQPNLPSLTIRNNNLKKVPKIVEQLTQLTVLDLRNNNLKRIPDFFGNLSELKYLMLDTNEISELPETMNGLNQLARLYLAYNKIKSIQAIKAILLLPELRVLDLRGNPALGTKATLYSGKHEIDILRESLVK